MNTPRLGGDNEIRPTHTRPLNGALEGVRLRKSKSLERNSHQSRV